MGSSLSRRNQAQQGSQIANSQLAQNGSPYGQYLPYVPRAVNNARYFGSLPTQYPEQYPGYRFGQPQIPLGQQRTELQQTKTIRNQVNLKKATLRVLPIPGQEHLLIPTFRFDASVPCSVTVFIMAKEDTEKGCSLKTRVQEPAARVLHDKGLGHVFPSPGDDEQAKAHSLNLNLYSHNDLTNLSIGKSDAFPLVFRLETVTEKGLQEGHRLEELEPGCATQSWVQSQTTYASLVKEEDGSWEVRTIRQKIWVENVSYELQEIYGIQDIYRGDKKEKGAALSPAPYSEDLEGRECVICLAAVRDTTVLPCRHMCMCEPCARELQRQQVSRCPICRDVIESLLHIKRPVKKSGNKKDVGMRGKCKESVSSK